MFVERYDILQILLINFTSKFRCKNNFHSLHRIGTKLSPGIMTSFVFNRYVFTLVRHHNYPLCYIYYRQYCLSEQYMSRTTSTTDMQLVIEQYNLQISLRIMNHVHMNYGLRSSIFGVRLKTNRKVNSVTTTFLLDEKMRSTFRSYLQLKIVFEERVS